MTSPFGKSFEDWWNENGDEFREIHERIEKRNSHDFVFVVSEQGRWFWQKEIEKQMKILAKENLQDSLYRKAVAIDYSKYKKK